MRKPICVFSHDSNPEIDSPLFHVSRYDADTRIDSGFARYLSPGAIQLKSSDGLRDHRTAVAGGLFASAWQPRWSDCFIVWQLCGGTPNE